MKYYFFVITFCLSLSCGNSADLSRNPEENKKNQNGIKKESLNQDRDQSQPLDRSGSQVNPEDLSDRQPRNQEELTPNNDRPETTSGANCLLDAGNDFSKPGPYTPNSKPGPSGYTIFYPENRSAGCKHPFVIWGNGTTQRGVASYGEIGKHLASYGLFVIHTHADGGGGLRGAAPMKGGIKVAKDLGASGEFSGSISENGGSSGHSQGGIGAQVLGNTSPEIKAVVDMMGGGVAVGVGGARHSKPTLLLTGSNDFMRNSIMQAFSGLQGKTFMADFSGVSHSLGPMRTVGFRAGSAAWFRCHLADDQKSCQIFESNNGEGIFSGATIKKKNF